MDRFICPQSLRGTRKWLPGGAGLLCPAQLLGRDGTEVTGPDLQPGGTSGATRGAEQLGHGVRSEKARAGCAAAAELRLCWFVLCAVRAERKLLRSDWLQLPD